MRNFFTITAPIIGGLGTLLGLINFPGRDEVFDISNELLRIANAWGHGVEIITLPFTGILNLLDFDVSIEDPERAILQIFVAVSIFPLLRAFMGLELLDSVQRKQEEIEQNLPLFIRKLIPENSIGHGSFFRKRFVRIPVMATIWVSVVSFIVYLTSNIVDQRTSDDLPIIDRIDMFYFGMSILAAATVILYIVDHHKVSSAMKLLIATPIATLSWLIILSAPALWLESGAPIQW